MIKSAYKVSTNPLDDAWNPLSIRLCWLVLVFESLDKVFPVTQDLNASMRTNGKRGVIRHTKATCFVSALVPINVHLQGPERLLSAAQPQ